MRIAPWILSLAYATAASAGPYSLSYGGRFADSEDKAVAGPVDIEVRFYRTASGGSQIGPTVSKASVELVDGVFQLDLDGLSGSDLHDIVSPTAATYIEIKDVTHGVTLPRQRLTAVPYAQKVPVDGKTVSYSASGELRLGVSGTPAANQFLTLDGSGNLVWGSPSSSGGSGGGPWTSADIVDGTLTDADISASAAISHSKVSGLGSLALASAVAGGAGGSITDGSITNVDIAQGAAIAVSKISGLGALATSSAVGGGAGGTITDGTITNDDIAAGAAIATSKISGLGSLATSNSVSGGSGGTIADGTITNDDIAAGAAITTAKISGLGGLAGSNSVAGGAGGTIDDGTITNDDIAPGAAIASSKIAGLGALASLGSVSSAFIDNGTIVAADIAAGSLTGSHFAAGALSYLSASDGAPSSAVSVDSSGNVGIGTTAPNATLQVDATSATRGFVVMAAGGQSADLLAALNSSGSPIARVTAAGEFSNPNPAGGSGTGNERFGSGAGSNLTTGAGNTLIGNAAGNSVTTGPSNTLIGNSAASTLTTGTGNVVIGDNAGASVTGNYSTVIGTGANTQGALNGCLALGWGSACTANNQMVAGSGGISVTDIYFGNGVVHSTPYGATVNVSGGTGTDVAGAALTLAGGKSTGNAAGGSVIFKTSPPGTPGSSLNGLVEAMRVTSAGNVGIGISTPGAKLEVNGDAKLGVLRTTGAVHSALRIIKVSNSSLSTASGSPTDLSASDHYVFVDAESAVNVYVRLPDASAAGMSGRAFVLHGKSSNGGGGNNVNISTLGGTINGAGSMILDAGTNATAGKTLTIISDGTNWYAF